VENLGVRYNAAVDVAERSRYGELIAAIEAEFPRFRIIRKRDSRFHRLIDLGLRGITLGRMTEYLDGYYTTIGSRLYVTGRWEAIDPDDRYIILRHELIHLRQFRRLTPPLMGLLYLLFPLPMGLAYFRARFEKEAYAETLRASAEIYGVAHIRAGAFRDRIVRQFTSASYGWMWPFRRAIERWYDGVVSEIEANR
jgi:hypothetical protein